LVPFSTHAKQGLADLSLVLTVFLLFCAISRLDSTHSEYDLAQTRLNEIRSEKQAAIARADAVIKETMRTMELLHAGVGMMRMVLFASAMMFVFAVRMLPDGWLGTRWEQIKHKCMP